MEKQFRTAGLAIDRPWVFLFLVFLVSTAAASSWLLFFSYPTSLIFAGIVFVLLFSLGSIYRGVMVSKTRITHAIDLLDKADRRGYTGRHE